MAKATAAKSPPEEALWRTFKSAHREMIDGWVEAERTTASSLVMGSPEAIIGDRLIAAEAELQRAIVDFAAEQGEGADPTAVALALLRRAEALIQENQPDPKTGSPG